MGTLIRINVATTKPVLEVNRGITRAIGVFEYVEQTCSRFDETSELRKLCHIVGEPVPVNDVLFQALRFAREVADATDGKFDPTIGRSMEDLGFNRHYLSGEEVHSESAPSVTYKDVVLNEADRTVTLTKPMQLDLGAVAKGLAVDLAVKELEGFEGFLINAGGDLYAAGLDEHDEQWPVGIQHPFHKHDVILQLLISNQAVCTSGSYERPSPQRANTHHIVDPLSLESPPGLVSCTVLAPYAMLADAFSTASFLYGVGDGLSLIHDVGLEGLMITDTLDLHSTKGFHRYLHENESTDIRESTVQNEPEGL